MALILIQLMGFILSLLLKPSVVVDDIHALFCPCIKIPILVFISCFIPELFFILIAIFILVPKCK